MSEHACFILLLTIELQIPLAHSLKDKRQQLRSLKAGIANRFNTSVAEIAYQDKWQRALLAVCQVGNDKQKLLADSSKILTLCQMHSEIEILDITQTWL